MRIAYLIIAHNHFDILKKSLEFLDSDNADFYIHIDKKVIDFDKSTFLNHLNKSKCFFIEPMVVNWGGYSLVKCTMSLLKEAVSKQYDYYHFLSGVDYPIKSKEYIEDFTFQHLDVNFIDYEEDNISYKYKERMKYYYFLQDLNIISPTLKKLCYKIDNLSVRIQKLLKVNRIDAQFEICLKKGAEWFSINHKLANKIIENFGEIQSHFKYSRCSDELFIQTMVCFLKHTDTLYNYELKNDSRNCARYIDWERGMPYIFKKNDISELLEAPAECLFARKFDDIQVINDLENYLKFND